MPFICLLASLTMFNAELPPERYWHGLRSHETGMGLGGWGGAGEGTMPKAYTTEMYKAYTIYYLCLFILLVAVIKIFCVYRGKNNILDSSNDSCFKMSSNMSLFTVS